MSTTEGCPSGFDYIGTEHILLALLDQQPDGALGALGLDKTGVEVHITEQLQKLT